MTKLITLLLTLISFNAYSSEHGILWLGYVEHWTHVPEHILGFILVGLFLSIIALIYRAQLKKVDNTVIPDKGITVRNLVEAYGDFIYGQCRSVIGEKEADTYFPFIATLFIVLLFSNLLGLIPGFLPPTETLNTTLAVGAFSFLYYNWEGIKAQGPIGYLKHFAGPLWYMAVLIFPLEIISHFVRPFSLALRLQGNITGDHLVVSTFTNLAPFLVPVIFLLLGLLVCVIQAYVFTVLSMVYISMAVEHHDHGDEAAAH
jgi:F-type H+-transporting ATPase subunit a